jgi:hypothetical protein
MPGYNIVSGAESSSPIQCVCNMMQTVVIVCTANKCPQLICQVSSSSGTYLSVDELQI